jgi:glutamate carboxypeptidase
VAIDSGTFDKFGVDRVAARLETMYIRLGAQTEWHRAETYGNTLVATLSGVGSGSVVLVGHTDTVYPTGTAAERPMQIDADRISGPGTADMKAGDLAIVYALRALLEQGPEHFGRITVIHNSDEEIGSPSSRALIAECSSGADAVLVLEPGRENGDVVVARKGIADIEIWVKGRSAHAGVNHDRGRSAVLALAHLIVAVESINGTLPDVTVNVGPIEGGERPNVVPDRAYCRLEVRAFERSVLEKAIERVRQIVASGVIDGTEARLKVSVEHWPMSRSGGNETLLGIAQSVGAQLGLLIQGAATGGASDGNTAAAGGTPVLDGLGPVGGAAHSPNEYIDARSIIPRTALLAGLIASLRDGVPGAQTT